MARSESLKSILKQIDRTELGESKPEEEQQKNDRKFSFVLDPQKQEYCQKKRNPNALTADEEHHLIPKRGMERIDI